MSRRFFKTIGWTCAALAMPLPLAAASVPRDDMVDYPPQTILLFVAGWCAPCRAEITRLDSIAAASRPFAVKVAMIDDTRAGREMVRGLTPLQRWQPGPDMLRRVRTAVFADTPGLPYSLAIDKAGRVCGDRRDGLDADSARDLVRRCLSR